LSEREIMASLEQAGRSSSGGAIPTGCRIVGALSIAYGLVMLVCLASLGSHLAADVSKGVQVSAKDAPLVGVFTLTPLPVILAGALLITPVAGSRATVWIVGIAALLLLFKALATTLWVVQTFTQPKDALDPLAAVIAVPMFIMPSSIWGVVMMWTAVSLSGRLRKLQKD
jgi:hypothetical protein